MLCNICNMHNASHPLGDAFENRGDFALGFVLGQTEAYIEQVLAGAKLAAQLGCAEEYCEDVVTTAARCGCETLIEKREHNRVAVWIFRFSFVRELIREFSREATPPNAAGVWAVGKLFGYGDAEIAAYLEAHQLTRSTCDSESNQHHGSDRCGSHTEQVRCTC